MAKAVQTIALTCVLHIIVGFVVALVLFRKLICLCPPSTGERQSQNDLVDRTHTTTSSVALVVLSNTWQGARWHQDQVEGVFVPFLHVEILPKLECSFATSVFKSAIV